MSFGGLIARFVASFTLVVATYNPSGYSFVGWVGAVFPHIQPLQAVVGIVFFGFWLFFLHATWVSLGTLGVAVGLAFFAAVIWLLTSWGWVSLSSHAALTWVILLVIASLLAIGLSWAVIRVRLSGQTVVEEVRR
jgi:hypothetical protein